MTIAPHESSKRIETAAKAKASADPEAVMHLYAWQVADAFQHLEQLQVELAAAKRVLCGMIATDRIY